MTPNPQQKSVIDSDAPRLLAISGAGSGKTATMIARTVRLLTEKQMHPKEVVTVTFTRRATAEMRERLEAAMPGGRPQFWRDLQISTFHSWATRLLRSYHDRIGFVQNFGVYDDVDRDDVIMFAGKSHGLVPTPGAKPKPGQVKTAKALWTRDEVKRTYWQLLKESNVVDFDGIEFHMLRLLRIPDIAAALRTRYKFVAVDEAQDLSAIQFEILDALNPDNLVLYGDSSQSIYKFRGADVEQFFERVKQWTVLSLPVNYRSRPPIVAAATRIGAAMTIPGLAQEAGRAPDSEQDPGALDVLSAPDRDSLSRAIVADMLDLHAKGTAWADIAILSPTWDLLEDLAPFLEAAGIPARVARKKTELWAQSEVRWAVNCMRVALNPDDHLSLWAALNAFTSSLVTPVIARTLYPTSGPRRPR